LRDRRGAEGTALKVEHDNLVLAVFNLGGRSS
jgi:hypothetical protein